MDGRDHEGNRPLHYACLHGKLDIAALLLRHHANAHEPNAAQSNTPLHLAVLANTSTADQLVRLLVAQPAAEVSVTHANRSGDTPFEVACELGKVQAVETMLKFVDSAVLRASAKQALHRAVRNGHDDIVRILLVHSVVDVNTPGREGFGSPLHEACRYGRFLTAKLLLESGADPHAKNSLGQSPVDVVIKQKVIFVFQTA